MAQPDDNPWHPWRLRRDEFGYEILRHGGWMVWADITSTDPTDFEIRAAIKRAEERRDEWLARSRHV